MLLRTLDSARLEGCIAAHAMADEQRDTVAGRQAGRQSTPAAGDAERGMQWGRRGLQCTD